MRTHNARTQAYILEVLEALQALKDYVPSENWPLVTLVDIEEFAVNELIANMKPL